MEKSETMQKENWFRNVDDKIKESDYPLHREVAMEKLRDATIEDEKASFYFDKMEWPINNREEFMERYRRAKESR